MMTTTPTPIRVGMPLDEFLEESNRQPFELINGEIKPLPLEVAGHSMVRHSLLRFLNDLSEQHSKVDVYMKPALIVTDSADRNWVVRAQIPDVMVYLGERLTNYKTDNPDWRERPYALVPDMVIEVISANDRYSDIDEKVLAYLSDGVRLIILVDPQRQKVIIHAPNKEAVHLSGDDILNGGEVLPAFQLPLANIFE